VKKRREEEPGKGLKMGKGEEERKDQERNRVRKESAE
jgi:hypothetical protein